MIGAINPNQVMQRAQPPVFNEGAGTTAGRVTAVVLSVLASLVSFLFLPVEGALMVSAGALALFSMCCCFQNSGAANAAGVRWYHPFVNAVPLFFNRGVAPAINHARAPLREFAPYPGGFVQDQPVANVGRRPQVGGGHRGAPLGGVPVMPMAWANQVNVPPVVHHQPLGGPPFGGNPRVPVGHGHR